MIDQDGILIFLNFQQSTSGALAGEEESDEESSSSSANVLEEFRNNWQKELQQTHHLSSALGNLSLANDSEESMAQKLFLQGTEYERMGKVFDAIRHYRRAVQLVPDIELRVRPLLAQQEEDEATEAANIDEAEEIPEEADDKEDLSNVDLSLRFQVRGIFCYSISRCQEIIPWIPWNYLFQFWKRFLMLQHFMLFDQAQTTKAFFILRLNSNLKK